MITAIGNTLAAVDYRTVRAAPDGRGFLVDADFNCIEARLLRFYSDVDTTDLAVLEARSARIGWPAAYCS